MMGPDLYLPPMVECRDLKALTLDKSNPSDIWLRIIYELYSLTTAHEKKKGLAVSSYHSMSVFPQITIIFLS